ncbi:MAG: hypothetical protein ACE5EA_03145 [Nitrospirota bacterium]
MKFEWDIEKSKANRAKHGIDFERQQKRYGWIRTVLKFKHLSLLKIESLS